MAPQNSDGAEISSAKDLNTDLCDFSNLSEKIGTDFNYKHKIIWQYLIGFIVYQVLGLVGLYQFFTGHVRIFTIVYTFLFTVITSFGLTMGVHRYFTHRTYKVTPTFSRVLIILYIFNGLNSLWEWVRNHRQHHKYSDTDADPHNAKRGIFFSHIGWYLCRKNPKVIQYGKGIDMSDINSDSWIMFQKKHFFLVHSIITVFIPSIIPILLWNEDPVKSFLVCYCARACVTLNFICSVNSIGHTYGTKPYDKSIGAVENLFVILVSVGDGWHNYHHVFPWDYKASEFGMKLNFSTHMIDLCAKMGWIYDRKFASDDLIRRRMLKTGDGSEKLKDAVKNNSSSSNKVS